MRPKLGTVTAPALRGNTVKLRKGRNGGTLKSGNPGNKGGGMRSKTFLEHCEEWARDEDLWREARKKNPNHVLGLVGSYTHGLPKQTTEHTGAVTIKVEYDEG